jgi:hypothetical protein
MTFRKSILLLIGLSMLATLVACGGGSSHTTPPPPVITVSVSAVSGPLTVNSQTPITATTTDTKGVNWSVTCATTVCGTFMVPQTTTGTANKYIAPPAPTTGVVITATSVTTNTISASTSPAITINGATLADGSYVFSLAGVNANGNGAGIPGNYYVAGEFMIAGGVITQGEQDFVDLLHEQSDAINGATIGAGANRSTIAYTPEGNVQITLVTCDGGTCAATDPYIGPGGNGIETLNGTILPVSTAAGFRTFITESDASVSASGELDPQTSIAVPTAGYAFVVNGYDHAGAPLAIGGILNIDNLPAAGDISGVGSIFDANDDFSGSTFAGQTFTPSTVSGTDQYGRFFLTLHSASFNPVLVGYVVDANQIRLVETSDAPFSGTLGGVAYSQGANTGTFTAANVAGTYVVGMSGADTNNPVLQVVNQLTLAGGAPAVTGFVDYNDIATSSGSAAAPATSPDPVTATAYALDASGAGDVTISNINDGTGAGSGDLPGVGYNLHLYLDGNGHALAISMDGSDAIAGVGFVQTGSVPFAATSFNGPYALDITGADGANTSELDGVGPVSASGSAETISGAVDLNWLFTATTYPATAVSGTFATTGTGASNGVFTGTITGVDADTCIQVGIPSCSVDKFSYYLIDATGDNIAIETDINQLTLGFFLQQ